MVSSEDNQITQLHSMMISKDKAVSSIQEMLTTPPDKNLLISKLPGPNSKCTRMPSPGLNSVGDSETSDYPRSTPSPGESESTIKSSQSIKVFFF